MDEARTDQPEVQGSVAAHLGQLASLDSIELESFLQRLKLITLEVIDEVSRKHGSPLLAQAKQALADTVGVVLKAELATLLDRLKPALFEGTGAVRKNADSLLADLKQFITRTVVEVFHVYVPEYSRWAGQRMIDYFLAGTLFCLAAVLACVGAILGLEQAGLPAYATYLIGGGVALGSGLALLKLRSRNWTNAGGKRTTDNTDHTDKK